MAFDLSTYEGRQAARDAGNWVGTDSSGNVVSEPGHPGGQAGPGGGGGGQQTYQPGGSNQSDILNAFKNASGFSLQDLAERKRQFDATLEWQKQMWANQGLPQLQIQQQAAALAQAEFEQQKLVAAQNLQLAQGAQGMDYLKTAASLGGPADYFQQSNFLRGASANPNIPTFLNALKSNTGLASFNAPDAPGGAPAVQSMANLAGGLTGAPPATNQQSALSMIRDIGTRGAQALAPQALEQLNPDELALFGSGMRASGFSMPSFLNAYQQSRVGQQSAQAG